MSAEGKLYKYCGPDTWQKMFARSEVCSLKCAIPEQFNDPYELFLTIDFDQEPDLLATYAEIVGQLPQLPTCCFSRSPEVIPMWAHYAKEHQGYALEFNESKLLNEFPKLLIQDVAYLEAPDPKLLTLLMHAQHTAKPRHALLFWWGVFNAAYFTKTKCWNYELERRVVAAPAQLIAEHGFAMLPVPLSCVTAIILGARASDELREAANCAVARIGCPLYQIKIGKSSSKPYFLDSSQTSWIFRSDKIAEAESVCAECGEPTRSAPSCSWCAIGEAERDNAATSNPLRILADAGLLDEYLKSIRQARNKS